MSPDDTIKRTSEHYSKQWGADLDFKGFVMANPGAAGPKSSVAGFV